ncbi:hypothetical protein SLOPH_1726 [Spraguea lophii 42_110]|uniref:C3H1-type domain-containing protein n=1 Tax=Spraguea lophii (strain 42_110) TaxID=1358809 RepID=S7XVW6_SPRLO|nr:hypothetical protein SLOPH_1726 [Spraguea lophii 42_110]
MEDCYFFLYSKCNKSDCKFRHSNSAKENTVLCKTWDKKKICRVDCLFRHSKYHLVKNRKGEMCYWETQSQGCTKEHCEFKHVDEKRDEWKTGKIKTLEEIKKKKIEKIKDGKDEEDISEDLADKDLDEIEKMLEEQGVKLE